MPDRNTPPASSADALRRMTSQHQRDTKGELELRSLLHRRGLRFRVHGLLPGLRRRSDIVFTRARVAVFVDGCFWHGCPERGSWPKQNANWWREKIEANQRRDRDTDARLKAAGWTVVRVWEHDDPTRAADRIAEIVRRAITQGEGVR
jgi:DNA mismatch endonuclease, patch repair protein